MKHERCVSVAVVVLLGLTILLPTAFGKKDAVSSSLPQVQFRSLEQQSGERTGRRALLASLWRSVRSRFLNTNQESVLHNVLRSLGVGPRGEGGDGDGERERRHSGLFPFSSAEEPSHEDEEGEEEIDAGLEEESGSDSRARKKRDRKEEAEKEAERQKKLQAISSSLLEGSAALRGRMPAFIQRIPRVHERLLFAEGIEWICTGLSLLFTPGFASRILFALSSEALGRKGKRERRRKRKGPYVSGVLQLIGLLFVSTGLESLRACEWLRQSSSGLGVSPSEEEGRGGDPLEAVFQGARNLRSLFLVVLAVGLRLMRVGDLAGGWFLSRTAEGGGADLVGSSGLSDVEDGLEAMDGARSVHLGSQSGSLSASAGRMKAGVCVAFSRVGLLYMALKTLSATYLLCVPSTDLAYFVAVHDLVVKVIKLGLKLADYSPPSLFSSSPRQSATGIKWWGKRSKSKKRRGREKKRKRKGREKRDKEGKDGGQGFLSRVFRLRRAKTDVAKPPSVSVSVAQLLERAQSRVKTAIDRSRGALADWWRSPPSDTSSTLEDKYVSVGPSGQPDDFFLPSRAGSNLEDDEHDVTRLANWVVNHTGPGVKERLSSLLGEKGREAKEKEKEKGKEKEGDGHEEDEEDAPRVSATIAINPDPPPKKRMSTARRLLVFLSPTLHRDSSSRSHLPSTSRPTRVSSRTKKRGLRSVFNFRRKGGRQRRGRGSRGASRAATPRKRSGGGRVLGGRLFRPRKKRFAEMSVTEKATFVKKKAVKVLQLATKGRKKKGGSSSWFLPQTDRLISRQMKKNAKVFAFDTAMLLLKVQKAMAVEDD